MAICKICGGQVVAGNVYHIDCIDAQINKLREENEALLEAAIEEIPHVGSYCAHLDGRGYCTLLGQICCRRVNTVCKDWKWRGLRE